MFHLPKAKSMLVSFFVLLFDFNSFTLITWQRGSDLPQYEGYIHRHLEMSYLQLIISQQMRSYSTIKAILTSRFTCFRDIRTIWGEQAHITQFLILVTQQNIQSLQLDILLQMRPYSSVEAIRGLVDFHLFSVFGEIGPI